MAYKLLDMRRPGGAASTARTCSPSCGPGIAFVDGVQQEGKASKVKARAA
jgi:hypothetical protein